MPNPTHDRSFHCPRCGSSEFETIPTYDEDDAPTGIVAVLCARCGHRVEDAPADAFARRELEASRG